MANMSKPTQLLVRSALVTGSTVATLIGAQTISLFDLHQAVTPAQQAAAAQGQTAGAAPIVAAIQPKDANAVQQPVSAQADNSQLKEIANTVTIAHVAPTIVVLSGDNQASASEELVSRAASVPLMPQYVQPTDVIQPTLQPTPVPTIPIQPTPYVAPVEQYVPPNPVVVQQFPVYHSRSSR